MNEKEKKRKEKFQKKKSSTEKKKKEILWAFAFLREKNIKLEKVLKAY